MIRAISRGRRGTPSTPILVAVVLVAVVLVAAGAIANRGSSEGNDAADRAKRDRLAVQQYADAVYPAAQAAGKAIVSGIRPDIEDFRAGRISEEVWRAGMTARAGEFEAAQAAFARTATPAILGDAAAWFDEAFETYLHAVRVLEQAASVPEPTRSALIDLGADAGDHGDKLFDHGAARIQDARRRLGLPPDRRFPDNPS